MISQLQSPLRFQSEGEMGVEGNRSVGSLPDVFTAGLDEYFTVPNRIETGRANFYYLFIFIMFALLYVAIASGDYHSKLRRLDANSEAIAALRGQRDFVRQKMSLIVRDTVIHMKSDYTRYCNES